MADPFIEHGTGWSKVHYCDGDRPTERDRENLDAAVKQEPLTVLILKDVLDGVEHYYGQEAIQQIAEFAMSRNRSRESNRVMDELERLYGSQHSPQMQQKAEP